MENPIDHSIDLGFVNYVQHPENKNYVVFRFADVNRANSFRVLLKENGLWYEEGEEKKRQTTYTLFALHNSDYKKAQQFNYAVEAKHKKPFIPFKGLRIFLLLLSLLMMTLATLGYCSSRRTLNERTLEINDLNSGEKMP